MREGTVDPDSIKIDGIDCDPPEVQAEKEVQILRVSFSFVLIVCISCEL